MTIGAFRNAWVLTGPSGAGKSDLALTLAEHVGGEIVAMDSMTLYRGMDVGTAKPSSADRSRVPHYLIDVIDPWEGSTVAWWLAEAARRCREIELRGKRALLVGGTPLYLKAALHGLFDGPSADEGVRTRLEQEAGDGGAPFLHRRLNDVDPECAAKLHPNDLRRIIRALEVWELTGRPISVWQQEWRTAPQDAPSCVWLDWPRAELHARIDARVPRMMAAGWVDEAKKLRELPNPMSREASQALGYAEIFGLIDGKLTESEAIERIRAQSRQYAKRQLTWFRSLPGCRPWPIVNGRIPNAAELAELLARKRDSVAF